MTALRVPSLNLMPAARVAAAQRRRVLRAWIVGCSAYALVLAAVWGYAAWSAAGEGTVSGDLASVVANIEKLKGEVKATEARHLAAQRGAEAAREVRNHPDFSVLLRLIASAAGTEITLDRLEVRPVGKDQAPKSDLAAPHGYTLKLTGLAAAQSEVPRFARGLQDLGIFEGVSIVGIKSREAPRMSEPMDGEGRAPQLFTFDIEGVFSDAAAGKTAHAGGGE